MKLYSSIQLFVFSTLLFVLSSCVPKATEKKAICGTNQAFNSITRSCINTSEVRYRPVATLASETLTAETAKTITLTYKDANNNAAVSCKVTPDVSNKIEFVSPVIANKTLFALADLVYLSASDTAVNIPNVADALIADGLKNNMKASLDKAKASYTYSTVLYELDNFKTSLNSILTIASGYTGVTPVLKAYYDATQLRLVTFNTSKAFADNRCECSGGVCTTVAAPRLLTTGTGGFKYTIADVDGDSDEKVVSVSIGALSRTADHMKPAAESKYYTFSESSTSTAGVYTNSITLPTGKDYFSTTSYTYKFSGTITGGYGITANNGKISGCMDLTGTSGATDNVCTYTAPNGDSFDATVPVKASVTFDGLTFTAKTEGAFANNYTIEYLDLADDQSLAYPNVTTAESYGLVSQTYPDAFVRVIGNDIKVFMVKGLVSTLDIQNLIMNDAKAKSLVVVTGGSAVTFPDPAVSTPAPVNLASGTDTFDKFSYTVNNGSALSTNTNSVVIRMTPTEDAPVFNSVASTSTTFNEDSGLHSIDLSPTYSDAENNVDQCNVNPADVIFLANFAVACNCVANVCTLDVTPNADVSSTTAYTFSYRVGSAGLYTAYKNWSITVTPINDVPVLGAIAGQSIPENSTASPSAGSASTVVGVGGGGFETSQTLTLTATSVNTTLLPNVACTGYTPGAGTPSGTVVPASVGAYYFDVTNKKCYVSTGLTNTSWELYPSLTVYPGCAYDYYGTGAPSGVLPSATGKHYLDVTNNKCYISTGTTVASWKVDDTLTSFYVAYVPKKNQSGSSLINLSLKDSGGTTNGGVDTVAGSFTLTVTPVNDPPYLTSSITIADTNEGGMVIAGPFIVDEDEGSSPDEDAQSISITSITSDNTSVLTSAGISIYSDLNDNGVENVGETRAIGATLESAGTDDSKLHKFYLKLQPVAGVAGNANITMVLSDGTNTTSKVFSLIVHPIAALHGGWTNIAAVGIKTDKSGAPANVLDMACNYNKSTDLNNCDGGSSCTGGAAPNGTIIPSAANVIYWDSANKRCYRSKDASKFSWVDMNISCPITRIVPTILSADIDAVATTLNVVSTNGFPLTGSITIDSEIISYTGKTNTSFTGLTRGASATTAAAHTGSTKVANTFNGDNFIKDSTNTPASAIPSATAVDQYYFDGDLNACHQSYESSPGVWAWSASNYIPSKVTLSWNPFTVTGSGAETSVSVTGWNVYRREKDKDFDYINGFLKTTPTDTMTISDSTVRTFVDKTAEAGKVYYYMVRPVDSTVRHLTVSTPEVFSEVRVLAPTPNFSFVHRWMVNQEVCNSMHMTTTTSNRVDPSHNYRCPYNGPGESTTYPGYYDIETDLVVDIAESGCPYTAAPACSTGYGCIGIGAPSASASANDIYYDRSTGSCYVNTAAGSNWVELGTSITAARVALTNTSLNAPLTMVTQAQADSICSARTTTSLFQNLGVANGAAANPTASMSLPSKKEYMAYSAFPMNMSDTQITDMEEGFSLNVQSRCNSSGANGVESAYTDSNIPSTSFIYSLPGTQSSGILSLYTGSVPWGNNKSTETCSSRYGVQDIYGNVAEWMKDTMDCSSPFVCTMTGATALATYDFDGTGTTHNYAFDFVTGPYNDASGDSAAGVGDAFLTNWLFRDEFFNAGKFAFPVGMPINTDIATALPVGTHPSLAFLLDIGPTSGITTSQLHEDGIIVNGATINSAGTKTGSFAQGGSYLSGQFSGRYSSELIQTSVRGPDLGFRCYAPVIKTAYPSDTYHSYPY